MDRRTFLMTGACLSTAAGGAWPWLAEAAARGNTLAIVDLTLARGAAFVGYAAHWQLPIFETGDDIGVLWYTALAPLLGAASALTPVSLIGLTRGSDYFVLKELVTRAGQLVEHGYEQRAGSAAALARVAFAFAPRGRR